MTGEQRTKCVKILQLIEVLNIERQTLMIDLISGLFPALKIKFSESHLRVLRARWMRSWNDWTERSTLLLEFRICSCRAEAESGKGSRDRKRPRSVARAIIAASIAPKNTVKAIRSILLRTHKSKLY